MNKQEALKRIVAQKETIIELTGWAVFRYIETLIEQLDEPQKVKVSEEEAKFLKTFDFNRENDVATALYHVSRTGWGYELTDGDGIELKHLTREARLPKNRKRLIKAILDGYEIEREPKYIVKLKNGQPLVKAPLGGKFYFNQNITAGNYKATRKELEESGFGEVFNSPLFEVEEVE
jgi:hypothetical protein|nr:MAG TPA: Protein of unknown function (DUF1642) [Caudoviricetes sp.]